MSLGSSTAFSNSSSKRWATARQLLKGDIERIIVHSVLDAPKPFARAEVISTGKGLLERAAFMVAGARPELWTRPLTFEFLLNY